MQYGSNQKTKRNQYIRGKWGELVDQHLRDAASAIVIERQKKKQKRSGGDLVSESSSAGVTSKSYTQKTIFSSINIASNDVARAAIAEGIHCCGLSFSLVDHPKFKNMLKCMLGVSGNFKFPNRKEIGGALLKTNYTEYITRNHVKLLLDAEIYGLTVYGDGAITKKALY